MSTLNDIKKEQSKIKSRKPKLIMIYGFAGLGKTTLAKKMNQDIPFSLCLEVDQILTMISQWLPNETIARKHVFSLTKVMTQTYLEIGHDVIIPYLLLDKDHAIELEQIAKNVNADFIELYIPSNKEISLQYIYERGTWGEAGSPAITQEDLPHLKQIYDDMEKAMKTRTHIREIQYFRNDITKTYSGIQETLNIY